MKKYLIKGLLALVAGGFTASCSDHDVDYVPIAQQKTQAYEKAFEEMIGGKVDANQNWGFEVQTLPTEEDAAAARAISRAASTNSNQWFDGQTEQFKHLVKPADVTAREEQVVSDWFKTNQNPTSDPISLSEFFVQQVYFGTKTYNSTDNNGNSTSVVGGNQMDWLYAWDPVGYVDWQGNTEHKDHINNFNTSSPKRTDTGLANMQLMQNSSTQVFGFHESYNTQGDRYYPNFVLKALYVDGVLGYYVGFDYESHGDRGDYDPDGYYDDRIIKIVPGNGVYPWTPSSSSTTTTTTQVIKRKRLAAQGRVFCEDLGQAGQKDIDFNDIVFDARIWLTYEFDRTTTNGATTEGENRNYKYEAEICLLAAGGTIDAKLADRDLHSIFEPTAGKTSMVNTVDDHADELTYWENSSVERSPVTFTYDMTSIINNAGYISLDLIPVEVMWTMDKNVEGSDYGTMKSVGVLNANLGDVPHKICLPIGTVWPSERRSIVETYPMFAIWATNRAQYSDFYDETKAENRVNTDYLYTGVTTGLPLKDNNGNDYYVVDDNNIYTNYTTDEILSSESYTVTETVTPIWEGGEYLGSDWGANQVSIGNSSTFDNVSAGSYLRLELTENEWWQFKIDVGNWNHTIGYVQKGDNDHGYAAKGYADVLLTADDLTALSASQGIFIVHGQGCTITKVSIVTRTTN